MPTEKTCCFTGHRELGGGFLKDRLYRCIGAVLKDGVDTFICGGALGFDTEAALAVLRAKQKFPGIKLWIFVPCKNQSEKWSEAQKKQYGKILESADYVDMPEYSYFDGCMKKRNYKMVDASSHCIAYFNGKYASGTGQTVRYALSKGLKLYNVWVGDDNE